MEARVSFILLIALIVATTKATALIVPYTEGFSTGASNWLNGVSAAAEWSPSGGVSDSAYISYTAPTFTSGSSSPFPPFPPPFQLMFRANTNASGGAFVGDWLAGGVSSFSVTARHNYESTLHLYSRLASAGGAGASLAFNNAFAMAPNTWTTINIPIVESDPPFLGYGTGNFNSVFTNMRIIQLGLYLPTNTEFTNLRMDLATASVVPEPSTVGLVLAALAVLALLRRHHRMCFRNQ